MSYDKATIRRIYRRTDGYCHICSKKVSLINYGRLGRKGAWEVEHSLAQVKGGTDHLNNLYPACIACNRSKGTVTSQTARSWNGLKKAPLSKEKKKGARFANAFAGGSMGALIGLRAGPLGAIIGSAIGAIIGHSIDPNKK